MYSIKFYYPILFPQFESTNKYMSFVKQTVRCSSRKKQDTNPSYSVTARTADNNYGSSSIFGNFMENRRERYLARNADEAKFVEQIEATIVDNTNVSW